MQQTSPLESCTSNAPSLPLELVELCCDLALAPATYRQATERYTTICKLCFVSKQFAARYQRKLFEVVVLPSPPQVQSFLSSAALQGDDPRRSWPRILKLGAIDFTVTPRTFGPPRGYELELGRLLERCSAVEELYLSRASAVSLHQLSSSNTLTRLHLSKVSLGPISSQSAAPLTSLTHLDLNEVSLLSHDALPTGPTLTLTAEASEGWHSFPALKTLSCTPDILRLSNGSTLRGQIAASDYFFQPSDSSSERRRVQRPTLKTIEW